MMHSPRAPLRRDTRVFISAVSRELGTVRQLVKKALEDSGYHVVEQATFPLDYRDVVDKLHRLLASCDAVIHIAGQYFGAAPAQRPDGTTHHSYTQLEYALARKSGKPVYVFITDDAFPTDSHAAEDEEHRRLQTAHRQALMQTGQDYCLALSHADIEQKVRSLRLQVERLTEELTRTDDRVIATSRRLGRRLGLILVLVLVTLGTLVYLVRQWQQHQQQARIADQATKGIAARIFDKMLTNKNISVEEARRQALDEIPALVDLPADVIKQLIDGKIAARVQEPALSPLERARAALAVGNYEAVFVESTKQREESCELAMLEGIAALARLQEAPHPSWPTKALEAFQRALALSDAIKQPLQRADAAHWVSFVLANLGRYGEAEPILRDAIQLRESQYGPMHPNVARELSNLARLLEATNRLAEAEPLRQRVLTIDEQSFGRSHPTVAADLSNLAWLLKATNRLAEAEPLLRRALTIDEQSFGRSHPTVAADLSNLARLLEATNRLAEAEPLLRRVVRILLDFTRNTGHAHPLLDTSTINYVRLLRALGQSEADIRGVLEALRVEPR